MTHNFLKPIIRFHNISFFIIKVKMQYEEIKTYTGLVKFTFEKLNELDTMDELDDRKRQLKEIAYPLYSILTGISYESKISI